LNKHTDFKFWQELAKSNPNFCPMQYHERLKCENCNCNNK